MRTLLCCVALLGCAPRKAAIQYVFVPVPEIREELAYPPQPPEATRQVADVVRRSQHLAAEVGRYTVWRKSKPAIIDQLGTLMATMRAAVQQVQDAKTLRDRAAALPAALAATQAVETYLALKGD